MRIQAIVMLTLLTLTHVAAQETTIKSTDMDALELTREWDKTFPQSDRVEHSKVTFHNRYGITLAADLYKPKNGREPLAAVAVSGPLCPDSCRAGLSDHRFRSFLLWRKRRYAALSHIARDQYGGFQRGGRLSLDP